MIIRPMMYSDLKDVATAHTLAWKEAYTGIIDQDFLDNVTIEKRTENWQKGFEEHNQLTRLVAETEDKKVVGFVIGGDEREDLSEVDGELYAIYIHPDFYHQGAGGKLYSALEKELKAQGYKKMNVWVLPENERAISFYKKMGAELTTHTKIVTVDKQKLPHISFAKTIS